VLEVKNVSISVERTGERMKISMPNTTVDIEIMKGKNGKPIKIENLPWPGFPAPPFDDLTQYKTIVLKHTSGDQEFDYTGTNGFTATIEANATDSH
jgi:UDP-N-acetylglucosamine enolpyruvyl transferase